jgi:hypothetical protein
VVEIRSAEKPEEVNDPRVGHTSRVWVVEPFLVAVAVVAVTIDDPWRQGRRTGHPVAAC